MRHPVRDLRQALVDAVDAWAAKLEQDRDLHAVGFTSVRDLATAWQDAERRAARAELEVQQVNDGWAHLVLEHDDQPERLRAFARETLTARRR